MNREPELSIIVPVYNVEEYLEDCVRSILNQTYQDYEIILIDDGSTDSSGQICDSFTDERIRVFHKENGGQGSARNLGLKKTNAPYITFIDSDDMYGDIKTLENCIHILKQNPEIEIIQFPVYRFSSKGNTPFSIPAPGIIKGQEVFQNWYRGSDLFDYLCWNKIYTKGILAGVFFPEDKQCEDTWFSAILMQKASCICTTKEGMYYYRDTINSASSSHNIEKKHTFDFCNVDVQSYIYELSTQHYELRTHRLSLFMSVFIWYMEQKTSDSFHDYSTIQKRFYSHKLKIHDIWWYIIKNNARNDSRFQPRYNKHLLAFYFLGHLYEWFYCTVLRLKTKRR